MKTSIYSVEDGTRALHAKVGKGKGFILYARSPAGETPKHERPRLADIRFGQFSRICTTRLDETHLVLGNGIDDTLDDASIWVRMQRENWSPNGQSRELIRSLGLSHTSMTIGDLILRPDPEDRTRYLIMVVHAAGFRCLGSIRPGRGYYPLL